MLLVRILVVGGESIVWLAEESSDVPLVGTVQ